MEQELVQLENLKEYVIDFNTIDDLFEKDKEAAISYFYKKKEKNDEKRVLRYVLENGKIVEYLRKRIFSVENGGFMIVIIEDDIPQLVLRNGDSWKKYEEKIKSKSTSLYNSIIKDWQGDLYKFKIDSSNYLIDKKNRTINLAKPFNYSYLPNFKASKEDKKNVETIMEFMKNIVCNGNDEIWKVFCVFVACLLHRKLSEIIVFLQGLGGIGKSTIIDIIMELVGKAGVAINDSIMTSSDKFNGSLEGCVFAYENEADAGAQKKEYMKSLKKLSTDKTLMIRQMQMTSYPVKNMLNFMLSSNKPTAVTLSERRVLCTDPSSDHQNDFVYFDKVRSCMTKGAMQLIFNYFYEIDTKNHLKIKMPISQHKADGLIDEMDSAVKFLLLNFVIRNNQEHREMTTNDAYKLYEEWAQNLKYKHNKAGASTIFRSYAPKVQTKDGKDKLQSGTKANLYDFSEKALINTIVHRARCLSMDQLEEMRLEEGEFNEEKEEEEEEKNEVQQLKEKLSEKDKIIENMKKEMKRLQEELEQMKKNAKKLEIPKKKQEETDDENSDDENSEYSDESSDDDEKEESSEDENEDSDDSDEEKTESSDENEDSEEEEEKPKQKSKQKVEEKPNKGRMYEGKFIPSHKFSDEKALDWDF